VSRGPVATVAWGADGLRRAVVGGDIPVIVDVLRFISMVTTAVANGFTIFPAPTTDLARSLAAATGAEVSGPTGTARWSLSPLDYVNPREPDEVIPVSPSGAALSHALPPGSVGFVGCLLNARAVEEFAVEDYLGCGVILGELKIDLDDEAQAWREAFLVAKHEYADLIGRSASGTWLAAWSP